MKLIVSLLLVCLAMVGLSAWLLVGVRTTGTAPATPPPPASAPALPTPKHAPPIEQPVDLPPAEPARAASQPFRRDEQSGANVTPTTAPVADAAPSSAAVHWPDATRDAHMQLQRAREALRQDPDSRAARHDEVAALLALDRPREAEDALARLIELEPDDIDLRFQHAALLIRLRRWVEAIPALREVIARGENHAQAWFNLAVAHQQLGHLHDARQAWGRAIACAPSPAAYARRGEVLLDLHEWEAAADDFQAVLDAEPDTADAAINLSLALWKLGRTDDARAPLLNLLERHPRLLPAINRLAGLAWHDYQQDPQANTLRRVETVEWCTRSLAIDPDQPEIRALRSRATGSTPPPN